MRIALKALLLFWSVIVDASSTDFYLERSDLSSVAVENNIAWIQLTPAATAEFKTFAKANKGNLVRIYLAGEQVSRFTIFAELDSGSFRISNPTDTTLSVLDGLPDPRDNN